ncbi:TetR family transcriptional regulator [Hoyosella rhizosphaerae]|uniref:TetR family transcriptional regulator n=1 Tax=Hoyosella rhizosphaerae TaxID=1755582 RepID=A0A916UJJ8_9ACTN|nr:TetR family transcriptional regulator [Hoyosella rhizosphaerae]MBN4925421.1 TetR family transcriptional regulator [Hoyosella rhizosphaerae]GGC75317.1 TetR family transcriptional regulator [Hoyosella rhizosphaerae]
MNTPPSLRERKKAATRAALSMAAVRITRERGIDAATADAIAAEAGVSARTFHNYFASREDAIVHHLEALVDGLLDTLEQLPRELDAFAALKELLVTIADERQHELADIVGAMELVESHPAVASGNQQVYTRTMQRAIRIIEERTGVDGDSHIYPRLVLGVANAAFNAAAELWSCGKATERKLSEIVAEAFDAVSDGLPKP